MQDATTQTEPSEFLDMSNTMIPSIGESLSTITGETDSMFSSIVSGGGVDESWNALVRAIVFDTAEVSDISAASSVSHSLDLLWLQDCTDLDEALSRTNALLHKAVLADWSTLVKNCDEASSLDYDVWSSAIDAGFDPNDS